MEAELWEVASSRRFLGQNARQLSQQRVSLQKRGCGEQMRDESRRLDKIMEETNQMNVETNHRKAVEWRKERGQAKYRREVEKAQRDLEHRYQNAVRFNAADERLREIELAIKRAEEEELECLTRLQNSERVRASVVQEMGALQLGTH